MDEMFESTLTDADIRVVYKSQAPQIAFLDVSATGGDTRASTLHMNAVKSGEKLLEALELQDGEEIRKVDTPEEAPNAVILGIDGNSYLLCCLEQIGIVDI